MKLRQILGLGLLVAVVLLLAGLGIKKVKSTKPDTGSAKLSVTASYYPLADFARNVGGDRVTVTNITPAGSEPHDYEPTPQQLVAASQAQVFVYNGVRFELWVDSFLPDYTHTVVKASGSIDLLDASDAGKPISGDPHFWLDPSLASQILTNIKDGLIKASPSDSAYFSKQAADYIAKLTQLDQDYKNGLANCQTRTVVTSHNAFSYLAKRYNIDVVSIAGISPDDEPSAARLAELTRLVRAKNIRFVLFESLVSPKLAQTIATEIGAQTAVFDPIEGVTNEDQNRGKDYISIQRENLASLRRALACQ